MKTYFRKISNEKGFTLIEAMIAVGIMTIGLVGMMAVMRRGLVNSVRAWDRDTKTSIAQSRLEEHKAQLYQNYVPDMALPVIIPQVTTGPTPGIGFTETSLTYTSENKIYLDATTNAVTAAPGYALIEGYATPTPGVTTDYYGNSNPNATATPFNQWYSIPNRSTCDGTEGNILFSMKTPPGVNGTVALWFVDNLGLGRQQIVWMNGLERQAYTGGVSMSSTPTAPTTLSFPVNTFDTASGMLNFSIQQAGAANDWGLLLEDGTNTSQFTINCGGAPTPTPSPTPPPSCALGTCNPVYASDFSNVSWPFWVRNSGTNSYLEEYGTGGTASNDFTVTCPGKYIVVAYAQTGRFSCNNSYKATLTNGAPGSVVPLFSGGVTTTWYLDNVYNCTGYEAQTINAGGSNFSNSMPATWQITMPGTYTLSIYTNNVDTFYHYPRINSLCLEEVSYNSTPTATPGMTSTPTPTPANVCSFPGQPTPLSSSAPGFSNYQGSPGYQQFWCSDTNWTALTSSGSPDATGSVKWKSTNLIAQTENGSVTGYGYVEAQGKLYADVHLMAGMSAALTASNNGPPIVATMPSPASNNGWYELVSPDISAGTTIIKLFLTFTNCPPSSTDYLAADSIRIVYDEALNPNAVLTGASLSVLDHYYDGTSYPGYVVDSSVEPLATPGTANGYRVQVAVHNARMIMATPTPPGTTSVRMGVMDDRFPPVTISNSISP